MKRIILVLSLSLGSFAFADTDYACMATCQQGGTMYGLCLNRCSYSTYQPPVRQQQTDYACMSTCQSQGYQYGLCKEKCSY
jgi:hypothetical protein